MNEPLPEGFEVTIDKGTRQLGRVSRSRVPAARRQCDSLLRLARHPRWTPLATEEIKRHDLDGTLLYGGTPARVLRLTDTGARAWRDLQAGPVGSVAAGILARTLTDTGLAHPRPPLPSSRPDVTIVVPARDRAEKLDACLAALGTRYPVVVVDDGSRAPGPVAAVAAAHGVTLLRRETNGGPAAARNTGLPAVETDLVAFCDSDCLPTPGWVDALAAHFSDPLVGAVAPRIVVAGEETPAERYAAVRGSLDLGAHPGRVAPGTRIAYVPTAALVVRGGALRQAARDGDVFDPALRFGEDVDLAWRLHAAGWRLRYDPEVRVRHREPATWRALLARRFRYGSSAGPLSRRHPDNLAPLVLRPWLTAAVLALLTGHPVAAAVAWAMEVAGMHRTLRSTGIPRAGTARAMLGGAYQTWLGLARYGTQFAAPLLLAGLVPRRTRRAAAGMLAGPALITWAARRPALDPARFTLGYLADEVCYGAGVLAGSLSARTLAPLRPMTHRSTRKDGNL